ncbi:Ger(x)C family spore germination protein [uncultured Paenibacillus sp.]|uniref:Ger(x)C family spore germination protein n=1 Tax=uncultured Paenibacillus sp. TaxID=227322 RepID=UPI0015AF797C|nr:Ger(x)C family spore germination protein [uncultured Paenibacillus sp.]
MRAAPAILAIILLLTGCWDLKEAQHINFVTALGVDYMEGRYIIYAQLLDFADIAKQEGKVETGSGNVWIGKGEGKTIDEALSSLYPASQQQTLWTHVRAIVFSKALLDNRLPESVNGLIQTRDLRYTPWVFGTDKEIPDIFSSISLLNESVLNSELLDPEEIFRQYSFIQPIRVINLMDGVKEPAVTKMLPLISWTDEVWKAEGKPAPQVRLVGAYAIAQGKNRGLIDSSMLQGARYVAFKKMIKYPVSMIMEDGSPVTLIIIHSDPDIRIGAGSDHIPVHLRVHIKAYISESGKAGGVTAANIKALAEKKIVQDIRRSFTAAKAKQIDLYNLEEKLYRYDQARWKQLRSRGKPLISLMELDKVTSEVTIVHSSSYKLLNR